MRWSTPANLSEIDLQWLLRLIPPAEAELYRQVSGWIAASPSGAGRIKMAELASRTGFSKRWVIELVRRLENKGLLQTEGGRGAAKRMRPLLPGGPPLEGSTANQSTQQEAASPAPGPGKAHAPRAAAPQPKRSHQKTAPSPKPGAAVKVAPPVAKPAQIPAAEPKSFDAVKVAPPLAKPAPIPERRQQVPMLPAPLPARPAESAPAAPPAVVTPPLATAPSNPVTATLTPAKVTPPPATAPGNPVVPAAPAKPVSPSRSIPKPPAAPPPGPDAPMEDLVAYLYQPVTKELIWSLETAAGNERDLRHALQVSIAAKNWAILAG